MAINNNNHSVSSIKLHLMSWKSCFEEKLPRKIFLTGYKCNIREATEKGSVSHILNTTKLIRWRRIWREIKKRWSWNLWCGAAEELHPPSVGRLPTANRPASSLCRPKLHDRDTASKKKRKKDIKKKREELSIYPKNLYVAWFMSGLSQVRDPLPLNIL